MGFLWDGVREAVRLLVEGDAATYHATWVSLLCTILAISVAALLAVPYGAWLGLYRPRGVRAQVFLLRVGMSVPTVVIGLLVYGFLSRSGPLGSLGLLYTKAAIVVGLVLLAFPLLGTLAHGAAASLDRRVVETALTLGAGRWRALLKSLGEARVQLAAAYLAAFGRCFTELGIAITVGGNLKMRTRTLPSSIQLELGRGDFAAALAPGFLLLLLAAVAALLTHRLSREARK
ncbi:MAG: ABC transporter permease [Planctomycetes bacterium]|nr:ABC transporter permease [Planctomycetota bacterium]